MGIIKKLAVLLVIILLIMFIYNTNTNNLINYVSLGDGISRGIDINNKNGYGYSDYVSSYLNQRKILDKYNKKFSNIDNRITDIIDDINDNVEVIENTSKISIKKALKDADIITISLGQKELIYKLDTKDIDNNYMDEIINDYKLLIDKIRKYCDKDIYIIGYYNPYYNKNYDNKIKILNNKLIEMCIQKELIYIDTYNLFKNNTHMINPSNLYPNKDGYKLIGREIVKNIEKRIKISVNN